jgi:hypothetical protein
LTWPSRAQSPRRSQDYHAPPSDMVSEVWAGRPKY